MDSGPRLNFSDPGGRRWQLVRPGPLTRDWYPFFPASG
jgi:hypothetical protein